MRSILGCSGLFAMASIWSAACGDATAGDLFPGDAGISGLPVLGGRGGRGGLSGRSGSGGLGGAPASNEADAGIGAAGAVGEPSCTEDRECIDDNACTDDTCASGECVHGPAALGEGCGSAAEGECTRPDSCDGAGACVANDLENGAACSAGACAAGACVASEPAPECPVGIVTELPFETNWRTVGRADLYGGTCDGENTPDFAVVFGVPQTAVYRFEAGGVAGTDDPESDPQSELADSVLTVAAGSCAGVGADQLGCNDDTGNTFDSRVDLRLEAGQTVTVYVNEFSEVVPGGGSGTLTIRQLSNDDD
jgi:hypothetical protein